MIAALLAVLSCAPVSAAAPEPALGVVEFDATCSAAAKPRFLAGLAALHSFWYQKAREEFSAAAAADPGCLMARWGAAMTYSQPIWNTEDLPAGRAALQEIAADNKLGPEERAFVDAARVLFGEDPKPRRVFAYLEAMEALNKAYPDEPEAAAFYSLALLAASGPANGPGDQAAEGENAARREKAAQVALALLAKKPRHPGAAHYAIHALDDPAHAAQALEAARNYASIAPASAHALHMPSHIFTQLGMWREAAQANQAAWDVSKDLPPGPGGPDLHSVEWLVYCRMQLGERAQVKELLDMARKRAGNNPHLLGVYVRLAAIYVIEARDWAQARALLAGPVDRLERDASKDWDLRPITDGLLALGLADKAGAAKIARRLQAARDRLVKNPHWPPAREAEIALLELQARADAKDPEQALALLAQAAESQSRQPLVAGPPSPAKPAAELYGELLMVAGKREQAATQFEAQLRRTPNRKLAVEGLEAARKP